MRGRLGAGRVDDAEVWMPWGIEKNFGAGPIDVLLLSSYGVVLGLWEQTGPVGSIAAIPIALWEFSLGVWLIVKGVRLPEPSTDAAPVPATAAASR